MADFDGMREDSRSLVMVRLGEPQHDCYLWEVAVLMPGVCWFETVARVDNVNQTAKTLLMEFKSPILVLDTGPTPCECAQGLDENLAVKSSLDAKLLKDSREVGVVCGGALPVHVEGRTKVLEETIHFFGASGIGDEKIITHGNTNGMPVIVMHIYMFVRETEERGERGEKRERAERGTSSNTKTLYLNSLLESKRSASFSPSCAAKILAKLKNST